MTYDEKINKYIDDLVDVGAYGNDREQVIAMLINQGVVKALADGIIEQISDDDSPPGESK